MKFLFLMDPLESVIFEKDTSFVLMLEASMRGHEIYFLPNGGMFYKENKVFFKAAPVKPQNDKNNPFVEKDFVVLSEDDVDAVFIRTDPPFDYQYLLNTWMLDKITNNVAVINNPTGIRTANEKIWATQFTSITPKTFVGRDRVELLKFLEEKNDIVVKPTDGFGGQSVFRIRKGDSNTNVILETSTEKWTRDIIAQEFIKQSDEGDKRILLLDGEPLGAVLRLHAEDDHRNNFFSGGKPVPVEITESDKEIIQILKPELKRIGLHLVGIDIIGDYLVEVNVTSPTCLQEMNRFYKTKLETRVIDFVEGLVKKDKK